MQIYSVHKDAAGIGRFLMLVRQSGNIAALDPDTHKFDVWSRRKDDEYGPNPDVMVIRQEEIGPAIEELEGQNTPEQLNGQKRPSSLNDILSMRKSDPAPVEAVTQPYVEPEHEEGDEGEAVGDDDDEENTADTENEFDDEPSSENDPSLSDVDSEHDIGDLSMTEADFQDDREKSYAATHETQPAMASLHEAAQTISNAKKDRILKIVQETLGTDLTDVSDILLMLSETAELKKALSAILAMLKIEVSMTAVSRDYKVAPQTIRFVADRTESLENYRRGVAQTMVRINEILSTLGKTEELEQTIKTLETSLGTEKHNATVQTVRANEEIQALKAKLTPRTLMPAKFIVFWKSEDDSTLYLTVEPGAKNAALTEENRHQNPPPPFEAATKRCNASAKQNEAHKFTSLESAQNQVVRLNKWAKQCAFFNGTTPTLSIARLGLDIVG